jgi:diguanylate cyclase
MKSFEILSEIIIETLKDLSARRMTLTPDILCQALLSKKETLAPLLQSVATDPENGESNVSEANPSLLQKLKGTYATILGELGPISRKEYVERSSELEKRIQDCELIWALPVLGDELINLIRIFVTAAFKEIDFAGDFLEELSRNLLGMEEQLFSYRSHNRETYVSNDQFCNHLLSNTEEMREALDSTSVIEDTRSLIASKLVDIKSAIEIKQQNDAIRLKEADQKIAELQVSLQGYEEEVFRTKERADVLEKEALLDSLTEIHNRRAYELRIREELKRYHRDGQTFSLVLIDIDRFKQINDLYGHQAGDKCLREIAKRIKSTLRTSDFLARYGGEEFIAILAGSAGEDAFRVAGRMRTLIERTNFHYREEEIPVTISLGVTEVRSTDWEPEATFSRVDDVMYQAKKDGRNRVCMT